MQALGQWLGLLLNAMFLVRVGMKVLSVYVQNTLNTFVIACYAFLTVQRRLYLRDIDNWRVLVENTVSAENRILYYSITIGG